MPFYKDMKPDPRETKSHSKTTAFLETGVKYPISGHKAALHSLNVQVRGMTEPSELRGLCVSHLMFRVKYCVGREKETVVEISALGIQMDPKIHLHRGTPLLYCCER